MEKKRHLFDIQMNSIVDDADNPTRKEVEFILHGFDVSHNYAFISKETSKKTLHTLKGMPIVAKYYDKSNSEEDDDALGSHEVQFDRDRDTDEPIITMGTVPIGVFTEDAYIKTITDDEGNEKEVVAGKGILWASRFPNVVGLLKEWMDEGISVVSSMEILYDSYKVEEGITEILNFVYEGHAILNSEERGDRKKVYPAYDESKLTKLVAEAIEQENKQVEKQESIKEGEKMDKFKKVFELSHEDVRSLIYTALDPNIGEKTYSYVVEVYENYFVANVYSYAEGNEYDKFFKFDYVKSDNAVEINFESKKEVFMKRNWEEVADEAVQAQLNEKAEKITELETQLNAITTDKQAIEEKFNSASETLIQLNSQVEALAPFKEQVESEKLEKALNEKKDFYSAKFTALNAEEKFKSEEVQALVSKTVFENEEAKDAILQLNTMLVEMVEVKTEVTNEPSHVKELASKRENLIPAATDFNSRYGA